MRTLKRRIWPVAVALLVMLALVPATSGTAGAKPSPGDASVITEWNQIAVNTVVDDPPIVGHPQALLYMGLFQAAVYDAVVGIAGRYEPYRFDQRAPHPSSPQAAAVAAAHELLVTYFSYAQATLDTDYASSLAQIPDGKAKRNGIAFGIRAADNLIALRAHDGRDAADLLHPATGARCLATHAARIRVDARSVARLRDAVAREEPVPVRTAAAASAHLVAVHK